MNYSNLLQRLNVKIDPLDKKNEEYKTIVSMIEKGPQFEDNYTVECVDIFNATSNNDKSNNHSSSTSDNKLKQSLLWYGCYNSSVAAKLVCGITPTFNIYTNYKSISCWDNIIGCIDNIEMSKFFRDKNNNRFQPNLGILMLVEVNYKSIAIPNLIKIDTVKSEDYTRNVLEYNEDDDTEDEGDDDDCKIVKQDNSNSSDGKEKFVYCKEINDQIEKDQILQITGELSPDPTQALKNSNNVMIPTGSLIPSTKIVKGNGWLNGYLKVWGKYNQFLVPSSSMIKLKYLVIVKTTPTNKYIKNKSISPSKLSTSSNNNNNNNNKNNNNKDNSKGSSSFKNGIWGNLLTKKKRTMDEVIDLEDEDDKNKDEGEEKNKKQKN